MLNRFVVILLLLLALAVTVATPVFAEVDTKQYPEEVLTPEPYFERTAIKLGRGVVNVITSPFEIPKQLVLTTQEQGPVGMPIGLVKGIGVAVVRICAGAWETVSFLIPNDMDGNFGPILKPEYVWDPQVPTDKRLKKSM